MSRPCEFINPVIPGSKISCPDIFFRIYHEKGKCPNCPKAGGFNNGVMPSAEGIAVVEINRRDRIGFWKSRIDSQSHRRNFEG